MAKLKIANLVVDFTPVYASYFKDSLTQYETTAPVSVNHTIRVCFTDALVKPTDAPTIVYKNRHVHKTATTETLYVYNKDNTLRLKLTTDTAHETTTIELKDAQDDEKNAEREYIISGIAFLKLALRHEMISLHGSAINVDGEAIVFSAPSQTGKSTQRKLWQETFNHITVINDDKPLIYLKDDVVLVTGTPWSGKNALNTNQSVPLKAIVFLAQGTKNLIEPLTNEEKLWHLMRNLYRPGEDELWDHLLTLTERLMQTIPMHRYHCTKDKVAVTTLYQHLFGGKTHAN